MWLKKNVVLSCLLTFCCLKKLQNWFPAKVSAILKHKIIVPTKQKFANLQKSHIPAKFSCFSVSFINSSLCITFALWGVRLWHKVTHLHYKEKITHTHTTTTLFMTIPIKSHISKTIDSKNLLRASQNTKSNQE